MNGGKEFLFLYPGYFFLIIAFIIGWWKRGVTKYGIQHPSFFILERFQREIRKRRFYRARRWFRESLPALLALSILVLMVFVLAGPVERTTESKSVQVLREGGCILDVSGSMTMGGSGGMTVLEVMKKAFSRLVIRWHERDPQDKLGCVVFANGATPLGMPTTDAKTLVENIENAQYFTSNYGGGTMLDRGLFVGFLMLTNLTPVDAAKFEWILRRAINTNNTGQGQDRDFSSIKKHIGPELMKKCYKEGKFALIFTDGIVELRSTSGMAPPLLLMELMGECGIVPFFITNDTTKEYKEVRDKIAKIVVRYGGRDYYTGDITSQAQVDRVIDDIMARIKPARHEISVSVTDQEHSRRFAIPAIILSVLWTLFILFRRTIPF